MTKVAILWNPVEVRAAQQLRDLEDAARVLGLHVHALEEVAPVVYRLGEWRVTR
jgi:hypothetical protein